MSLGLAGRFKILEQSPLDTAPVEIDAPPGPAGAVRLVPSRYNVRARAEDGRLVVWNTFKNTINVFQAGQREAVERLLSRRGFAAKLTGMVKYLYDRGFIIEEGTDEYRRMRLGFGKQHYRSNRLELILLASEDCNFRCQYCYEDFPRGTMQPHVRNAIKELVRRRLSGLRIFTVSWFGGEPLYGWPAIEDLAPFFVETSREAGLAYASSMTTNGYLLTPERAEKLLAWRVTTYQITLDGMPDDHDRSRPTRDGQGTFDAIFRNLLALQERPEPFRVDRRVNYDARNARRLPEFLGLVEDGFRGDPRFRLRFHAVGRWGGPNDDQLEVCGVEDREELLKRLRVEARRRGLTISDSIRDIQTLGSRVCYAARPYNFVIGASGQVMKCTIDLDKHDRNVVGRLTGEGELQLDEDKMALWTEPAFESDGKCQKCVVLPACQGISCPLVRIESGASPCIPLRHGAKAELRSLVAASSQGTEEIGVPAAAVESLPIREQGPVAAL
jgi:uncharacterized protein